MAFDHLRPVSAELRHMGERTLDHFVNLSGDVLKVAGVYDMYHGNLGQGGIKIGTGVVLDLLALLTSNNDYGFTTYEVVKFGIYVGALDLAQKGASLFRS